MGGISGGPLGQFSGQISDVQHGIRTLALAHALPDISGVINTTQHGSLAAITAAHGALDIDRLGMELLTRTVVPAGGASVVDWQNILPSVYESLVIDIICRSEDAALRQLYMRFNNDSTNGDYGWARAGSDSGGTYIGAGDGAGAAQINLGYNDNQAEALTCSIVIPGFARTQDRHTCVYNSCWGQAGSQRIGGAGAGVWFSAAAINRLQFLFSAGDINAGSAFTLYARRGS